MKEKLTEKATIRMTDTMARMLDEHAESIQSRTGVYVARATVIRLILDKWRNEQLADG